MTRRIFIVLAALCASVALAAERPPPVPVAPGAGGASDRVGTICPTFHWGYAGTAERFELAIHSSESLEEKAFVTRDLPGLATGWTPSLDQCLQAGRAYAWRLRAVDVAGPTAWSPWSRFEIAPSAWADPPSTEAAKGAVAAQLSVSGGVVATTFSGDGSALANVDAATLDGRDGSGYTISNQSCASGTYVSGIDAAGNVVCSSLADYVNQSCHLYFGWRDACDGCTTAPAKWGRTSGAVCEAGIGANGTCSTALLGTASIPLYGLNTDGDVDDSDKFYVGLRCF